MFFVISKERLIKELEHNAKHKGKGVLNWFIKNVNGINILNIIYSVYGVHYLYTCKVEEVDTGLKFMLDSNSDIIGIIGGDYLEYNSESDDIEVLENG